MSDTLPIETIKNALEMSLDAIVIVNSPGQIVIANSQAANLFGYALDDLIGQSVDMLLPERLRAPHPLHRKRYFAEPHARPMGAGLQLFGLKENGSEFPVDIELRPLPLEGEIHALAYIRDITMQNEMQKAILAIEGRITEFRAVSVDVTELRNLIEMHVKPLSNTVEEIVEVKLPQLSTRVDRMEESVNEFNDQWKEVKPTFERIDRTFAVASTFFKRSKWIGILFISSVIAQFSVWLFHILVH